MHDPDFSEPQIMEMDSNNENDTVNSDANTDDEKRTYFTAKESWLVVWNISYVFHMFPYKYWE